MWRAVVAGLLALVLILSSGSVVRADATPSLRLREANITADDELVVLQNVDTVNIPLKNFWLGYSNDDTAKGGVPTLQLPDYVLEPGQSIMLAGGAAEVCDASYLAKLPFTLSNTKGSLAIRQQISTGDTIQFSLIDSVNWSNTKTTTDAINLTYENAVKTASGSSGVVWYKDAGAPNWQPSTIANCAVTKYAISGSTATGSAGPDWQPGIEPPATLASVSLNSDSSSGLSIPAQDQGLRAPLITEVFANPASPQTDDQDEFVELYNSNAVPFDLSGFKVQTGSAGSATKHTYTFPDGTLLPSNGFMAFSSGATSISLSNSGGQVWLLDPFDTTIAQTDPYGSVKNGVSWVLANGKWYWTSTPTPGKANVVTATGNSSKKSTSAKTTGMVKGASTAANKTSSNVADTTAVPQTTPVHPLVLALVAGLAVVYGLYEYRQDVANRFHQLRKYRENRRESRTKT